MGPMTSERALFVSETCRGKKRVVRPGARLCGMWRGTRTYLWQRDAFFRRHSHLRRWTYSLACLFYCCFLHYRVES